MLNYKTLCRQIDGHIIKPQFLKLCPGLEAGGHIPTAQRDGVVADDLPLAYCSLWDESDVKAQSIMVEAVHRLSPQYHD